MRWNGEDLFKSVLLGSGSSGGGSGGGGSSGGASGVSPKEVNFWDYDGTCVHAYTVEEAQKLSALPDGPEHDGLVFQGWNWSLEGVKGLTRAMNIGAMYTTDDGTTRLHITLQEGRTSPMLGVGVNGTVTVDWGDGTEPDVLTGTKVSAIMRTPNHAYAKPGDYVIRLTVDGEMTFNGYNADKQRSYILRHAYEADTRNVAYQAALKRVEIGSGISLINSNAFLHCYALESVTIPYGVETIGTYAFDECYALKSVSIPDSVKNIYDNAFYNCYTLETLSLPAVVENIGTGVFAHCHILESGTLPNNVAVFGTGIFGFCYAIASMYIPDSVTLVRTGMFNSCFGVAYYDFTSHTAVPTLEKTNAFTGIPADCEIRVPAALYDEWIAATNWSTYSDYIKAY